MTNREINAEMAALNGWSNIREMNGVLVGCYGPTRGFQPVTDYCHDLNACHEAESRAIVVAGNSWKAYDAMLCQVTKQPRPIDATARQRCEALLRTLGKWRGE